MVQYCRYCTYCISGDCYYCNNKDKVLSRVDIAVKCKDFELSALGDVDTGKKYKSRIRTECQENVCDDQMTFEWLTKTQGYSETDAKNMIAAAEELISKATDGSSFTVKKNPLSKQRTR